MRVQSCGAVLLAVGVMFVGASGAGASTGAVVSKLPPVASTGDPRYLVQALSFKAIDESGIDRLGSDEVVAVWDTPNDQLAASRVYGDVDAGNLRTFPPEESCITPIQVLHNGSRGLLNDGLQAWNDATGDRWACRVVGTPAPLKFDLVLFERDSIVTHIGPLIGVCFDPMPPPTGQKCADDVIDKQVRTFTSAQLKQRLPAAGSTFLETLTLGGPCGYNPDGDVCGSSGLWPTGPEYTFTYRVLRTSDAPPARTP